MKMAVIPEESSASNAWLSPSPPNTMAKTIRCKQEKQPCLTYRDTVLLFISYSSKGESPVPLIRLKSVPISDVGSQEWKPSSLLLYCLWVCDLGYWAWSILLCSAASGSSIKASWSLAKGQTTVYCWPLHWSRAAALMKFGAFGWLSDMGLSYCCADRYCIWQRRSRFIVDC